MYLHPYCRRIGGRMLALAQVEGMMAVVQDEMGSKMKNEERKIRTINKKRKKNYERTIQYCR